MHIRVLQPAFANPSRSQRSSTKKQSRLCRIPHMKQPSLKDKMAPLGITIMVILLVGISYYLGGVTGTKNTIDGYRTGALQITTTGQVVLQTDASDGFDAQGRKYPDIEIKGNKVIFVPAPAAMQDVPLEDQDEVPIPANMTAAMRSLVLPTLGQVDVSVIKFEPIPEMIGALTPRELFAICAEKFGWKALSSLREAELLPNHLHLYDATGRGMYFFYRQSGVESDIRIGHIFGGQIKEVGSPMTGGPPLLTMIQSGAWVCVR